MIKIGIIGYGNLGKGVQTAISHQNDLELFGVFTKRDPNTLDANGAKVFSFDNILDYKDEIDVLIHCGSSEYDLKDQTPELVKNFNIIDSYDQHGIIDKHIANVAKNASDKTAIVSVGWDPGLFSINRVLFDAILPNGEMHTYYGPGMSQGATNVANNVAGVINARNYAYPNEENIKKFKNFEVIDIKDNHMRKCFVLIEEGANQEEIEKEILDAQYFKNSGTEIIFVDKATMTNDHKEFYQSGRIIRRGHTSEDIKHVLDLHINLDSNPEFTASNLVTYARACYKMNQRNEIGAFTAFDVRPSDLTSLSKDEIIRRYL